MSHLESNKYCVYLHKINGLVVYVGSGNDHRPKSKSGRQQRHLNLWDLIDIEIISGGLSLKSSRLLEQELILKYESNDLLNKQKRVPVILNTEHEMLSKFLYYDESSSTMLRWKVRINQGLNIGDEAGCKDLNGYVKVTIKGRRFYVHRVVYCLFNGVNLQSTDIIDHIDYVKHNNSPSNLQLITASENVKRSVVFKGNMLNERNIVEILNSCRFKVTWVENLKVKFLYFSYKLSTRERGTERNYSTRESALQAAINFRNSLVTKGFILTKEE